jgi:hypothetical protein
MNQMEVARRGSMTDLGEPKQRSRGNAFTRALASSIANFNEAVATTVQIGDQLDMFEPDIRLARQLAKKHRRGRPRSRWVRR